MSVSPHPPRVTLLGPQRHAITVTEELDATGLLGRIAVITAGWQEREAEDDELQEAVGRRAINLRLHQRVDRVFAQDAELFAAHRKRQDRLRHLQDLYRLRLDAYLGAAQALYHREDAHTDLLAAERAGSVRALQELDEHHLRQIRAIHEEFETQVQPGTREPLRREREEVLEILSGCELVAIAGGHVATLLARIRLMGLADQLGQRPILAWSAGAMVLSDRLVLFHDNPPEGPGNAEVLDVGLGLAPGVVPLPHASKRLRLHDGPRMACFAQRFAPAMCLVLDPYSRARWDGTAWHLHDGTFCLDASGQLASQDVAAAGSFD